ncbi:MAG: diguanylate cyclase [Actinobacteria bacterium]|nr:diguanylate cyclase [Actinomycetota bacterium]MCL5883621.1 diguanylate cyclase [Actinomycetota bacterium]
MSEKSVYNSHNNRLEAADADLDQAMVDMSPDIMALIDPEGNFIRLNRKAPEMCLYDSVAEMMNINFFDMLAPEDHEQARAFFYELVRDGGERIGEFRYFKKDGSVFSGEINAALALDAKSGTSSIIAVIRDVGKRKLIETEISRQSRELAERNSELQALYEISQATTDVHDTQELILQVLDSVSELRHLFKALPEAGIFLIEDGKMRLAGHTGGHSDEFLSMHDDMQIGDCLCGKAAQTGEIIISDSSRTDPGHDFHNHEDGEHAHIIVPLGSVGEILGVLYLYLPPGKVEISERRLRLLKSISSQIASAIENVKLHEKTRELSLHDPLTGLANRRLMTDELEKTLARSKRSGKPFSLIMLDLDHFKDYNDHFGHASGDNLLVGLSDLIRNEIRRIDLAVRYGGEEFLIILPETGMAEAMEVAERIRSKTGSREFVCSDSMTTTGITVSLGVSTWDRNISSEEILIARADTALYRAKSNGRDRVESWIPSPPKTLLNHD